jgi:hypothetical protein
MHPAPQEHGVVLLAGLRFIAGGGAIVDAESGPFVAAEIGTQQLPQLAPGEGLQDRERCPPLSTFAPDRIVGVAAVGDCLFDLRVEASNCFGQFGPLADRLLSGLRGTEQ